MQEVIADSSPQTTNDFAGLLAKLAAANRAELHTWNDEELSTDVATLSYERALRTHMRYKAADESDESLVPAGAELMRSNTQTSGSMGQAARTRDRDRKCSSVTLRMSKAECEQLRVRAAEAGLTVSAYLRLCAFEAEALRAEVKEALAELRRAPAPEAESARCVESFRGSRLGWLRRMMPNLHPERSVARA
jgi:hypothetical protein